MKKLLPKIEYIDPEKMNFSKKLNAIHINIDSMLFIICISYSYNSFIIMSEIEHQEELVQPSKPRLQYFSPY